MHTRITHVLALSILLLTSAAQSAEPSLIVVISIDQFRYDYLTRFREHFGKGGFNLLLDDGANFSNATFKHAINKTGPGHASLLSGSYGNVNGIITNNWYDTAKRKNIYCVQDDSAAVVGAPGDGRSPRNFIGTTFGDALRMHTSFQSKVISVSNKDRGAVLMGGKLANGAFWMQDSLFITSTYYMNELPEWVRNFNSSGKINSYFGRNWEKLLPENAYALQDVDDAPYESGRNGLGVTFPHPIVGDDASRLTRSYYYALLTSPSGNEVLAEFAKRAIKGEDLGTRGVPDLLCISFSANDYVGHAFGPHSHEVLDMTVHTDRVLADLFEFLDEHIGLRNCVIVLTSDHGVAPIPEFVRKNHPHAESGRIDDARIGGYVASAMTKAFGALKKDGKWYDRVVDNSIYLNPDALSEKKITTDAAALVVARDLATRPEIAVAYTRREMMAMAPSSSVEQRMKRSFHHTRSGDVVFALRPSYVGDSWNAGTNHGQPYDYDAHVPMIFVGDKIRGGTYAGEASPVDIGPTLSALLGVEFPAGREGRVLTEALKLP